MANMHVRTIRDGIYEVVCHYPIAATGNNSAGLQWRTAYLRGRATTPTTVLPAGDGTLGTISAAETTSIQTGAVAEEVILFTPPGDWETMNATQRGAAIDSWYSANLAAFNNANAARLAWLGFTR